MSCYLDIHYRWLFMIKETTNKLDYRTQLQQKPMNPAEIGIIQWYVVIWEWSNRCILEVFWHKNFVCMNCETCLAFFKLQVLMIGHMNPIFLKAWESESNLVSQFIQIKVFCQKNFLTLPISFCYHCTVYIGQVPGTFTVNYMFLFCIAIFHSLNCTIIIEHYCFPKLQTLTFLSLTFILDFFTFIWENAFSFIPFPLNLKYKHKRKIRNCYLKRIVGILSIWHFFKHRE